MTGIAIPGFELIEKIGAGGMATVWKARQISLNREVAIKILYSKFASDASDVTRFQTEAQSAARLKHAGIVQVYDANALGGLYYFVMEYVPGYSVGEWIKRKGHLPLKDALLVAECVVDALEYVWNEAGIIHCDVKPDNLLVDTTGSVKVSDLGLARTFSHMLRDEAGDEVMGTPAYISPEQASGQAGLDFRADIYSLGATLYHMVTGVIPFAGNPPEAIMDMHISATIPDPVDVRPGIPAPVAWLIEKMMCKKPEGRQQTWNAVRLDIERVKRGLRPLGNALPAGVSTVERSAARNKAQPSIDVTWKPRGPGLVRQLVNLAILLGLAGAALFAYLHWQDQKPVATSVAPVVDTPAPAPAPTTPPPKRNVWAEEYQRALSWVTAHPGHYDEGIEMLSRVANGARGTEFAGLAQVRVDALLAERARRVEEVLRELDRVAGPMQAGGRHGDAARVYSGYAGALAGETAAQRQEKAEAALAAASTAGPAPVVGVESALDAVAKAILAGNWKAAQATVATLLDAPDGDTPREALEGLRAEVDGAVNARARVLQSFERQRGESIAVRLRTGPRELTIREVRGDMIVATVVKSADQPVSQGTIEFGLEFLSAQEYLLRMGADPFPGMMLVRGLLAFESRSMDSARRYLAGTSPLIAQRLLAGLP